MSSPLSPTDRFIDSMIYSDQYTVYERPDGTAYKISVSRYSGAKTVTEYANVQAYRAWRRGDDLALDPEGKGHKGATSDGGKFREWAANLDCQSRR